MNIPNDTPTTIASLNLDAGSYLVCSKLVSGHSGPGCQLFRSGSGTALDTALGHANTIATLALMSGVTLTDSETIRIDCTVDGAGDTISDIKLTAVKVGSLN